MLTFAASEPQFIASRSRYNESETRREFIDPLLDLLGWDSANKAGVFFADREVIREESQDREDSAAKRPDYTLRVKKIPKCYVEAKRPSVDIVNDMEAIRQTRMYGYTVSHAIAVLTNFRDFCIYDTTIPVLPTDSPETCRIFRWHYDELEANWDTILHIVGRSCVGEADWSSQFGTGPLQPFPADQVFVRQLNLWRIQVGQDIDNRNPGIPEPVLNDVVQRLLNRLIFVRMCEDRGIEGKNVLKSAFAGGTADIKTFFKRLDDRYNTGLFADSQAPNDPAMLVSASLLSDIVDRLYSPMSTLSFAVLNADFLGLVYESTLAEHLTVTNSGASRTISLNTKPEYGRRDVVATPQLLVDSTVDAAAGQLEASADRPKVLDFATGSGRFLVSTFDRIVERTTARLQGTDTTELRKVGVDDWRLTFEAKKALLSECFFGIDIDFNAVEVARFSLLVRLLEDESSDTLPAGKKILPSLDTNIIHGNTLVRALPSAATPEELGLTQPLDLSMTLLPNKFDLIIGNPPYMKTEEIKNFNRVEYDYLKKHYSILYQQFDKYMAFMEFALGHLDESGCLGVVIPNKWMIVVAGQKLRARLRSDVRVVQLANFRHVQVFEEKSIYVCSLVAKCAPITGFAYTEPESISDFAEGHAPTYAITPGHLPSMDEAAWVLPGDAFEDRILKTLRTKAVRLEELLTPRNGIQTSANNIYIIKKPVVQGQLVTFTQAGNIHTIELGLTRPYLDGSAGVASYHEVVADALVIFPYQTSGKPGNVTGWEPIPEATMKAQFPLGYRYLSSHKARLARRDIGDQPGAPFYVFGRNQAIAYCTQTPKIFYSVLSQSGDKYGLDTTGIVFASGGTAGEVALYPESKDISLDFVLALLDQRPIEFFLHKRGSAFRGGYFARGTDVIADVPVPKLDMSLPQDRQFHDDAAKAMRDLRKLHMQRPTVAPRHRTQHEAKILATKQSMDALFQNRWQLTQHDYDQLKLSRV